MNALFTRCDATGTFDKYRLRRRLKRLIDQPGSLADFERGQAELSKQVDEAVRLRQWRADHLPHPKLDSELPIAGHAEDLITAIQQHQVIVVCGETGSGKSTQLPLIALQAGFGVDGMIGHTQPRRIAARSVAARLAENMECKLGEQVGFKIRFDDGTQPRTFVKLMTDGILLAETQSDRFLNQYSLLIVDEAHERSLNIDFLLGNIQRVLQRRPELRLVITSATIDTERFAEHFASDGQPAPIFNIEGRTYPVDIQYRPPADDTGGWEGSSLDHLVDTTLEAFGQQGGDFLVFLPTEQDIRHAAKKLRGELNKRPAGAAAEVLPLYARLTTEQQNLIFHPGKRRRIVLATNVAESSVTVPRISCVVDAGTARISRYSPRRKVQRLPIEAVSQASANQRAGRCGRIGPGTCFRLYSREDFESRSAYTTPEIRRTHLAAVILQSQFLQLGPIEEFPFIDPPREDAVRDGYKTLFEIGAIDDHRRLTAIGRKIAALPVDPRIGRILLAAADEGVLARVLVIAAGLEIQDPRVRPAEKQQAADQCHAQFEDPRSDFIGLLKIWDFYQRMRTQVSRSKLGRVCTQNFLSLNALRQWHQLVQQLKAMCQQIGVRVDSYQPWLAEPAAANGDPEATGADRNRRRSSPRTDDDRKWQRESDAIHRSLLAGMLSGVAQLTDKFEYTGAGGVKFRLWPGSGAFKTRPTWVLVAEIVETSQTFGRMVAGINPSWIEALAPHLVKRQQSDPHWSSKQQTVMAHERVTLFGLPIVANRRVRFGPLDPEAAREIFIDRVLAENEFDSDIDCLVHNQLVLEEISNWSQRTRQRELIIDSHVLYGWYDRELPEEVFDFVSLQRAIDRDPQIGQQLMFARGDLLENDDSAARSLNEYPERVSVGGLDLQVEYRFTPGDEADGASIQIPRAALGQLNAAQTPWLIPGLLAARLEAMIRSLPKSLRRNLVPAPDTARAVAEQLRQEAQTGPAPDFFQRTAQLLSARGEQPIEPGMLREAEIAPHLVPNLQVIDDENELVAQSRSLAELRSTVGTEQDGPIELTPLADTQSPLATEFHQDNLRGWDWGDLPRQVDLQRGATTVPAFPAIVDQGEHVNLRLLDSAAAAERATRQGLMRLYWIANRKNVKSQVNWLPDLEKLMLSAHGMFESLSDFKTRLGELIVRVALVEGQKPCRSAEEFTQRQAAAVERIGVATQDVAQWLPRLVEQFRQARSSIDAVPGRMGFVKADARQQLDALFENQFLVTTPWPWLRHFPRYLQAIAVRCDKLLQTPADREKQLIEAVQVHWEQYQQTAAEHRQQGIDDIELVTYRWMIEEYRVSLFAQQLGTSQSVSPQRLDKQFRKVTMVY